MLPANTSQICPLVIYTNHRKKGIDLLFVKLFEAGDNILCFCYDIDIVIKTALVDVNGDYNVNLDSVNERSSLFWTATLGVVFTKHQRRFFILF